MKHTQFAVLLAALLAFTACSPEPQVITQTLPEYVTAIRGTGTYEVYHLQHTLPDSYTDTENPASPENYEVVKDDTQEKELSEGSTIDDIKNDYSGFSAVSMTQNGNAIYVYYDRNTITYTFKAGQPEDSDVKGTFADGTTEKKLSGLFGEAVDFDPPEVPDYTHEVKGWKPELPSTFGAENTEFTAVWGPPLTIRNGVLIKCNPNVKGPVTIPDGVTSIGGYAFYNCSSLTSVTIPASVSSIGEQAFYNCSSLTSVTIPDGVTSIGDSTFSGCSSLTTVEFNGTTTQWATITKGSDWNYKVPAKTVTCSDGTANLNYTLTIKDGVLTKCTGSANGTVIIPEGVTSIGDYAFYNCSSLTSVTIPASVSSIGRDAFAYCSSLTSVTIPASVSSIGREAFAYCSSLTSVTIPASVSSIGREAFAYCSSLTTVEFNGTTTQWATITKGSDWNYKVPAKTVTCSDGDTSL